MLKMPEPRANVPQQPPPVPSHEPERKGRRPLEQRRREEFEERRAKINELLSARNFRELGTYLETEEIPRAEFKGRLRPLVGSYLTRYVEEGHLWAVLELSDITGIRFDYKPIEHAIQMAYGRELRQSRNLREIDYFAESTGIKPDLEGRLEPVVQQCYADILRGGDDVVPFEKLTGIKPDYKGRLFDTVQDRYADMLIAGNKTNVDIWEYGGVNPDWSGKLKPVTLARKWRAVEALNAHELFIWNSRSGIAVQDEPEYRERVQDAYERRLQTRGPSFLLLSGFDSYFTENVPPDYAGRLRPYIEDSFAQVLASFDVPSLRALIAKTGIRPDFQGTWRPRIQKAYEEYAANRSVGGLRELIALTGVEPEWDEASAQRLQGIYTEDLRELRVSRIKDLAQATRIEPDWSGALKPEVAKAYRQCLRKDMGTHFLSALIDLTGIRPDYEGSLHGTVVEQQKEHLRTANFEELRRLADLTDIQPDYRGELLPTIQSCIRRYLRKGQFDPLEDLASVTGVQPDWRGELERDVHQRYADSLDEHNVKAVKRLMMMSGIRPDFSGKLKERVHATFASTITHGRLGDLKSLELYSGETPDYESLRPKIQKVYKKWVARGSFEPIDALEQQSGIAPDYAAMDGKIQHVYARYLNKGQTDRLSRMRDETGVAPDFGGVLKPNVVNRYLSLFSEIETSDDEYDTVTIDQCLTKSVELAEITGVPECSPDVWRRVALGYYGTMPKRFLNRFRSDPTAMESVREGVRTAFPELLSEADYGHINQNVQTYDVVPERTDLLNALTREISKGALPPDLLQIFNRCNVRFELTPAQFRQLNLSDPRTAAIVIKFGMPKKADERREVLRDLEAKGGWLAAMPELINICGPAARAEFCPWEQRLGPLLVPKYDRRGWLPARSTVDIQTDAHKRGFIEFVRRFGAIGTPRLARTVMDLEEIRDRLLRHPNGDVIVEIIRGDGRSSDVTPPYVGEPVPQDIADYFGHPTTRFLRKPEEVDELIGDLERAFKTMRAQILHDEIPAGIQTALGAELFNAVVPRGSSYGDLEDRQAVIAEWRVTVDRAKEAGHPNETRVPNGYVQRTYPMRRIDSDETSLEDLFEQLEKAEENQEALAKQSELLHALNERLEAAHKKEQPIAFLKPFMRAAEVRLEETKELRLLPARTFAGLVERLEGDIEARREQLKATDQEKEGKRHAGISRAIEHLERQLNSCAVKTATSLFWMRKPNVSKKRRR